MAPGIHRGARGTALQPRRHTAHAGPRAVAPRHRYAGVTLIELMIVIVVIAILGTLALPSYRQHVLRAQRMEAKAALLRIQAGQERFYLQHNRYTDSPALLGFTGDRTDGGHYTLSIAPAAGGLLQGYVATATPAAGGRMTDDTACAQLQITSEGRRLAAPDPQGRCW